MISFMMKGSVEEEEENKNENETDEEDYYWDSSEYDSSSEDEELTPEGEFKWTTRNELALLYSLTCKPVGICRHFVMAYIHHKFTNAVKAQLSAQAIWDHLDTLWDMKFLEQMYRRDMKEALEKVIDFELPFDEYGDLMARKVGVGKCFLTRGVIRQARQVLLEQYRARALISKIKPSYVKLERIPDDVLAQYTNSNCLSPVAKRKKVSESSPGTNFMELNEMAGTSSKANEDYHRLTARHCKIAEKCLASSSSPSSPLKKFIEKYAGNECSYLPCVVIEKDLCSLIEGTEICLSSHDAKILNLDKNQHCSEIMQCNEKGVSEKIPQSEISQIQKSQESCLPNVLLEKNLYPEIKKAKVQVSSDVEANIANVIETGMGNEATNNDDANDPPCNEEGNMKIAANDFITKDNIFDDKCEDEICYQEESLDEEPFNAEVNFDEIQDLSDLKAILKIKNIANGIETDKGNKAMHDDESDSPPCSKERNMKNTENYFITKDNIFDEMYYQEESFNKDPLDTEFNFDEVQDLSYVKAIFEIQNIANRIETDMGNKAMHNDDANSPSCSEEGNMKIAENYFITTDNIFNDKCEDEIRYQEESLNKEPLNAEVNFDEVLDLSDLKAILKIQNIANGIETDMENKVMYNDDGNFITTDNIFDDKCEDEICYQEEFLDKGPLNAQVNFDEVQDLYFINIPA